VLVRAVPHDLPKPVIGDLYPTAPVDFDHRIAGAQLREPGQFGPRIHLDEAETHKQEISSGLRATLRKREECSQPEYR